MKALWLHFDNQLPLHYSWLLYMTYIL
jgi:hypothetical protein